MASVPSLTGSRATPVDAAVDLDDLLVRASGAARFAGPLDVVHEIDRALDSAADRLVEGQLHLARAVAMQFDSDAGIAARSARRAAALLTGHGASEDAFPQAILATLERRTGRHASGLDLGTEMFRLADTTGTDPHHEVRTACALSWLFLEMSAFDHAVAASERALDIAIVEHVEPIENTAFACAFMAIESVHSQRLAGGDQRSRLASARRAAEILTAFGADRVSRHLMGRGVLAQLALLEDDVAEASSLVGAGVASRAGAADLIVAWHRLVEASVAAAADRPDAALALLDAVIPVLSERGAPSVAERAVRLRSTIHRTVGRLDDALDDAMLLADLLSRSRAQVTDQFSDQIGRLASLERDRSALSRRADELLDQLARDPITQVHTRRWLEARLDELALLPGNRPISIVMLDLDRFKSVNDTYGHGTGDSVLASFGALLAEVVGDTHSVARFGGEEFVVLVEGDAEHATALAEEIRSSARSIGRSSSASGLHLTVSAGIASGPPSCVRETLDVADEALLAAKRAGRDRVVVHRYVSRPTPRRATPTP